MYHCENSLSKRKFWMQNHRHGAHKKKTHSLNQLRHNYSKIYNQNLVLLNVFRMYLIYPAIRVLWRCRSESDNLHFNKQNCRACTNIAIKLYNFRLLSLDNLSCYFLFAFLCPFAVLLSRNKGSVSPSPVSLVVWLNVNYDWSYDFWSTTNTMS